MTSRANSVCSSFADIVSYKIEKLFLGDDRQVKSPFAASSTAANFSFAISEALVMVSRPSGLSGVMEYLDFAFKATLLSYFYDS
jgi:hypothetical protein